MKSMVTHRSMRIGETTGETVRGRGSRNPYSPGSYRTAGGSRVQNREMESENLQTTILHKSCKMRYNLIDIAPE